MKTCSKCKEEKPDTSFGRSVNSRDGRQGICKRCMAIRITLRPSGKRGRKVKPRTSPYVRMNDVLNNIEGHADDPGRVREIISVARATYKLPGR